MTLVPYSKIQLSIFRYMVIRGLCDFSDRCDERDQRDRNSELCQAYKFAEDSSQVVTPEMLKANLPILR